MLKQLRKRKIAKKILWTLAIIIIPPFIFWGSGSLIKGQRKSNFAGMIFGRKISFSVYKNASLAVRNQARLQYGEDVRKIERYLGLPGQAWDRLILLHEADKRKIKVPDTEVIAGVKMMFRKDGLFNQKIYDNMLIFLKIPARAFEENLRDSLKIAKLYEQVTSEVDVEERELEDEYKKERELVKTSYISILPEQYKQQVTIEEEEIKNYFEKKKEYFLRPASVNIEYIGLDYPPDAEEQNKEEIRDKLQKLRSKIRVPSDIEKINEEESLTLKETGFFSAEQAIPQLGWSKEFNEICFNLTEEDISPPIDTPKGIYILRLKEKRPSYLPEIEEVKDEIIEILTMEKAHITARQKAEEILLKLKEKYSNRPGADFSDLAKTLGLTTKETPLFKRNVYIEEIGMSKEFSDAAFGLGENEVSGIIETPTAFYILKVSQFVEIDKEKFTQEREEFRSKLLAPKKQETFIEFLQALRNKANLISHIERD